MRVKDITLSTNPTIVVGTMYIKAGASVTLTLDDNDNTEEALEKGKEMLVEAYRRAIFVEMSNINSVMKRETRVRIIRWLKGVIYGKSSDETSSQEKK